jgi:hypothetical protein
MLGVQKGCITAHNIIGVSDERRLQELAIIRVAAKTLKETGSIIWCRGWS